MTIQEKLIEEFERVVILREKHRQILREKNNYGNGNEKISAASLEIHFLNNAIIAAKEAILQDNESFIEDILEILGNFDDTQH